MKTIALTRTMGYIMSGGMLIAGSLLSAFYFDKLPWAINRWILYTTIVIMLVVMKKMYDNQNIPRRFFLLGTFVVILGVLEIGSGITLTVFALGTVDATAISFFDRVVNTITVFALIIYNMIAGVWLSDRVTDIKGRIRRV